MNYRDIVYGLLSLFQLLWIIVFQLSRIVVRIPSFCLDYFNYYKYPLFLHYRSDLRSLDG